MVHCGESSRFVSRWRVAAREQGLHCIPLAVADCDQELLGSAHPLERYESPLEEVLQPAETRGVRRTAGEMHERAQRSANSSSLVRVCQ